MPLDSSLLANAAAEALTLPELLDATVVPLRRLIGATHTLLYRHRGDGSLEGIAGDLAPALATYDETLAREDPTHRRARILPPRPRVVLATARLGPGELRRSAAWTDWYRLHDLERLVCVWLTDRPYGAPGMTGLLLGRPRSRDDFGERESALLSSALPAFSAAVRRCERVERMRRGEQVAQASLTATDSTIEPASGANAPRRAVGELRARFQLTAAESRVLRQLALGLSNAAIAERLGVSVETVRTHAQRLFGKLGVSTRAQAAALAWSAEVDDA